MQAFLSAVVVLCLWFPAAFAEVRVPSIFADHAVLQRSPATPVWGWAGPGEEVRVTLGNATSHTLADQAGRWMVALDLEAAGEGPHDLAIRGKNSITLRDVLVGQVWLASGQSNMEWTVANALAAAEVTQASANNRIRQFDIPRRAEPEPVSDLKGTWSIAGPDTTGNYSAVAYHFARTLEAELGEPVAIVLSAWGGSALEAWLSPEALDSHPELSGGWREAGRKADELPAAIAAYRTAFTQWMAEHGREDKPADPAAFLEGDAGDWAEVAVPAQPAPAGEPGALWLRRAVTIEPSATQKPLRVQIGNVRRFATVYWNGEEVFRTTPLSTKGTGQRTSFDVPPERLREGPNQLAIRLFDPAGAPGIGGDPRGITAESLQLAGTWKTRRESTLPALTDAAPPTEPKPALPAQSVASRLYNGMIAPLIPFRIAGAIWYQGESNAGRAAQYHSAFPLLITDWRKRWQCGDFPFYWCQLAAYMAKSASPGPSKWAELREAQSQTLGLTNTGQAVLIDLGEAEDIHPRRKEPVGNRLAAIALARTYRRDVPCTGPELDRVRIDNDRVILTFTGGELVAQPVPGEHILALLPKRRTAPLTRNSPESQLEGFEICGSDARWSWAEAAIAGNQVIVSSPQVPQPIAVRYAWSDNPTANLTNKHGLPASPFRTDNFPLTTAGAGYP